MKIGNSNNGGIIITLIILGAIAGFAGWITSEAYGRTIHGANNWLIVMWVGWALCAIGLGWLATTSKGSK